MGCRLALLALLLARVVGACGTTVRTGPDGAPPLALGDLAGAVSLYGTE